MGTTALGLAALAPATASAAPRVATGLIGYAFNVGTQDVTLFDVAARRPLGTRPLGAQVRYLSSEQAFWDGRYIWTYDFPGNVVQAIAVDPRAVSVARTISTGGAGPAHSLMLTPDHQRAWVNVAGGDVLAILDLASGQVVDQIKTGKFPCDIHFAPDGRFGFVPERDQDTVSKVDLATGTIVKTISFPAGSKPYMLRVSPDGKEVWVQTAVTNTNAVLDSETMAVLATAVLGKGPVTNAFQPGGRYGLVTHASDTFVSVVERQTGREVTRIDVGKPQASVSFTPDGATAFVAVMGADDIAVIDMAQLAVVARIPTGKQPMGLVLLEAASGPPGLLPPMPGLPATGGGGAAPATTGGHGGWLLTLGGLAVLAGLRLRRRQGHLEQADYRRHDPQPD